MRASHKLAMVDALQTSRFDAPVTNKMMDAISGHEQSREEGHSARLFPQFSWNAKQALQLALVIYKGNKKDVNVKVAVLELSKLFPALRPQELLAVSTALDHGVYGLKVVKPTIKMMTVGKRDVPESFKKHWGSKE